MTRIWGVQVLPPNANRDNYATLHYTTQDYTTLHYSTLHYTRPITPPQYDCNYSTLITNYTTPQLQLHYATTTTTAAVHHTTSSSCGWGDHCNHCNHSKKHNSNHLSVNQWIRSAIRDSQQPTSPVGRFPILKLPPPPCAVLLVISTNYCYIQHSYHKSYWTYWIQPTLWIMGPHRVETWTVLLGLENDGSRVIPKKRWE